MVDLRDERQPLQQIIATVSQAAETRTPGSRNQKLLGQVMTLLYKPPAALTNSLVIETILAVLISKRDIYHCALVCKVWKEVAIPLLWREIDRVETWLSLIGPVIATADGVTLSHGLDDSTLDRFHYYAKLIQHMTYSGAPRRCLHPEFTAQVQLVLGQRVPLFPNLKSLQYRAHGGLCSLYTVLPLASAVLQDLRVAAGPRPHSAATSALFGLAAWTGLRLYHFKLLLHHSIRSDANFSLAFNAFLQGQKGLRSLTVKPWPFSSANLASLAQSILHLEMLNTNMAFELMEDVHRFLSTVGKCSPRLLSLTARFDLPSLAAPINASNTFAIIEHILVLRNLQHLALTSRYWEPTSPLQEQDLQTVRMSLPDLKSLSLFQNGEQISA